MNIHSITQWILAALMFLLAVLSIRIMYFNYHYVYLWAGKLDVSDRGTHAASFAADYSPIFIIYSISCIIAGIHIFKNTDIPIALSISVVLLAVVGIIFMDVIVVSAAYELTALPTPN